MSTIIIENEYELGNEFSNEVTFWTNMLFIPPWHSINGDTMTLHSIYSA